MTYPELLAETREALARVEAKIDRLVALETRVTEHEIEDADTHATLRTQVKWLWAGIGAVLTAWLSKWVTS